MIVKLIMNWMKLATTSASVTLNFLVLCSINFHPAALSASTDFPVGARSLGMGSTYVALANTVDALFINPAGLSRIAGTEVSLFYQKPFGLEDVNFGTAAISFPVWGTRLSLGYSTLGNVFYQEQHFRVGYSRDYVQKIFYGLGLNYQIIQIDGNGSAAALALDIGVIAPLTDRLSLGFTASNINRAKIGKSREALPQSFNMGLSLHAHPKLILNAEIFKDIRFEQELRLGAEFQIADALALRSGTGTHPNRFSAGFGIRVDRFIVDYAFFTHNDLGLTHQVSLSINFEPKAKEEKLKQKPIIAEIPKKPAPQANFRQDIKRDSVQLMTPININTATAKELVNLPGIGKKLAASIVSYREQQGPFMKIDDLQQVPGIGSKTLAKIKIYITVGEVTTKD
ncbi:MAG: helix-hairpin-helix domain-containing protein [bacterium]